MASYGHCEAVLPLQRNGGMQPASEEQWTLRNNAMNNPEVGREGLVLQLEIAYIYVAKSSWHNTLPDWVKTSTLTLRIVVKNGDVFEVSKQASLYNTFPAHTGSQVEDIL